MKKKFLSGLLALAMTMSLSVFSVSAAETKEYAITDSESIRLLGRGEVSDGSKTFNWSNSGFEFSFSGTEAYVNVTETKGNSYFNVSIDGDAPKRILINKTGWTNICSGLSSGEHTVRFVRSSSGQRGVVKFDKIKTDAVPKATEEKERRIEFIGDSYTTGYGNIATDETWEAATSTDSWYSYAGYTARELDADYNLIAYAGRGVIKGYDAAGNYEMPYQFGLQEIYQNWDAVQNMSTGAEQDFSEYDPQLVVIWLGTNDQTTGVLAADFEAGYKGLLEDVKAAYPDASILCLSKANEGYPTNINNAIDALGGEEAGMYYKAITTYSGTSMGHPSKAEAKVIGEELTGYIKELNVLPGVEAPEISEEPEFPEIPEEPVGYELLYYNTFDDVVKNTPSAMNTETESFKLTVASKGGWNPVTFDGENGVATNTGAWPSGQNILFDFTKSGGVTGGIYKFSWDFSSGKGNGGDMDTLWVGMNMSNHYEGGRLIRVYNSSGVRMFNPITGASGWSGGTSVTLDNEIKYHVEYVMNMETKKAYTYLNGTYIGSTNLQATMKNFNININGYIDYFDNLKLEKCDEFPEFKAEIGAVELGGIEVVTTSEVKDWKEFAGDIKIKRRFDGKEMTATVTPKTSMSAKISAEDGFENGYNYEIILPESITGLSGESFTFENNKIDAEFATENAAVSIKLKNYAGEIVDIQEINSTEIQSIVVEFTDDVDALDAIEKVVVRGCDGDFDYKAEGNVGEVVFTDILQADTEYTIAIRGLTISYRLGLETGDGSLAVKAVKLYNADNKEITKAADVKVGDKIKAKLEIANTTDTDTTYLGTVTMYNGKLMTGANFESNNVLANNKTVSEFEFEVSDTKALSFAGLIWHATKTAPLAKAIQFELK